ncbi:MAG TPA: MATE family efflux transporter, partial [Candidatus Omnitrophota bacterium]|nr:MATE family efflux transporter [Candidatus Omnitrophota bacterium]
IMGVGFMAVMAAMLTGFPMPLIDAFLDFADPATAPVVAHAVTFLAVAAIFQIADGAQVVGAGALRGLKDTKVPMMFAGLGYWLIAIPLGAVLAFAAGLDGLGIWIGLAVGLGVVASLMLVRWVWRERLGLVPLQPHQ